VAACDRRSAARARVAAEIEVWAGSATAARYALVWQPPAELFALERDLRVMFNLGAGVEALLAQAALPRTCRWCGWWTPAWPR